MGAELEGARAELERIGAELEERGAELEDSNADLAKARVELEARGAELEAARRDLLEARAALEATRRDLAQTRAAAAKDHAKAVAHVERLEERGAGMERWIKDRLIDAAGMRRIGAPPPVATLLPPAEVRDGVDYTTCPKCNADLRLEGKRGLRCLTPGCNASWHAYGVGPLDLAWGFSL